MVREGRSLRSSGRVRDRWRRFRPLDAGVPPGDKVGRMLDAGLPWTCVMRTRRHTLGVTCRGCRRGEVSED